MRVVIVAESFLPRVNGVSNSVMRVARHLRDNGHDVMLICPDAYGADFFEDIPVHLVRSLGIPGVHEVDVFVGSIDMLHDAIMDFDPDILHLASPFLLGRAAAKIANQRGIPTVAIYQTDIAGFAEFYRLSAVSLLAEQFLKKVHELVDLTLAPSRSAIEYLEGLGVPRVRHWGRGVDVELFNPRRRQSGLFDTKRITVGYIGRLAPEKNIDILECLATDPRVELVVIGDGPQRQQLEQALPRARFTGRLGGTELGDHVASLDIVVAPGERETFCQVIQEAFAAGVPVVAPAIGGPLDLVRHGRTGFLYTPGDPKSLQLNIEPLIEDSDLRQSFGRNARQLVEHRTWNAVCDELLDAYFDLIQHRSLKAS